MCAGSVLVIRPATQADVEGWYGARQILSIRAVVGELDGEVVAIGGVYRDPQVMVGIAGLKDVMRTRKKDIVRMVRAGRIILQQYANVIAFASKDEQTADAFIRHLGFSYIGATENGEVYQWIR